MKKITLRAKITATIAGLLALTGIFYAASPTEFATIGDPMAGNIPVGVASTSSKLLVTEYTTQNIDIIDDNGAVSLWATIPNFQGNAEKYIAISPGFGQWDPDYVYVTQGADIYKFGSDGTTSITPFVTLQDNQGHGCGFDETGITFDQVGTFGYDMILTCVTGDVWRVNPAGTPTWVANTGTELEGPAVAPQNFGPYGGQIWAADEDNGQVHAIGSDGSVHNVVAWQGAEGVLVIPSNPCTFADSTGISFAANQNHIYKFSQNDPDLASAGGNILVTSETGAGIGLISFDGTNYNTSLFDNSVAGAEYEGAAFVDCQTGAPTPTPTPTVPAGTPTATPTASPTPCNPLAPCTPTYPFGSNNPLTNVAFNESGVLRIFTVSVTNACLPDQAGSIQLFYNDEHALTLGVRQVTVKTSSQTTTTNYPISALPSNPGSATNPQVGSTTQTGDQSGTDVSGRPMFPALFITDETGNPPNAFAGDWQYGGKGIPPTSVFGTWKGAVRTVDYTRSPTAITITPDADPVKNNWSLGPGSDAVPAGLTNEGYGAEVRWDISQLGLLPGHTYRLYFIIHDGDQNKAGGDSGQGCSYISMPSSTGAASPTATPSATPSPSPTPTPTPTPIAPPSASLAVAATIDKGSSLTTASFTLKANTTYLVFAFTNSNTGDSATFSSTFSGSSGFMSIGAGSQVYNTKQYTFGRWMNGGATDATGKITVTFAQPSTQAYVQVIELSGNNLSNPIAQSAYASGNNTNPYTANLPSPPSSGNNEVDFLTAKEDLGAAPPAASAKTSLVYAHKGDGTAGSYTSQTATQNTSFSGPNKHWGTIAVEINHN